MKRLIQVCALFLLLFGCSQLPRQIEHLANVEPCCSGIPAIKFHGLETGVEKEITISETTAAYQFPKGKSYFTALQLPPTENSEGMELKTYLVANPTSEPQVFCPTVTYYDRDFQVLSSEMAMLSYSSTQAENSGYWHSHVPIPFGSRYAIIHTESQRVGNLLAVSTAGSFPFIFVGAGLIVINRGGPGQHTFQCGVLGAMTVLVGKQ